jgi:hypothetical protein
MMSEHEAATLARATVWLDTSNDAPTKRGERLEAVETASSPAFEAPPENLETARYPRRDEPETAVLDRTSAFAAFESLQTDRLEQAPLAGRWLSLANRARRHAERWLVLAACAGALAVAFALGRATASRPAKPSPRAVVHAATSANANAPKPLEKSKPAVEPTAAKPAPADGLNADTPSAVDALARGEYDRALALYRSLANQHPNDAAFTAIVKVLGARQGARCPDAQTGGPLCDG